MRIIRATDIGAYIYCQRAWWYQQQGYQSANIEEMATGSEMHYQHGRKVLVSGCIRVTAYALLLVALVLLAMYVTNEVI